MILADKIIYLRKKFNYSQEELAEKLNVSRQSVSKWEGALSIPDMNKILQMSDLFGVSTDYLMRDELEVVEAGGKDEPLIPIVTHQIAKKYVADRVDKAKMISTGVLFCVNAAVPLILVQAIPKRNVLFGSFYTRDAIGLFLLFLFIVIGVAMFVKSSHLYELNPLFETQEFELEYGVRNLYKEQKENYKGKLANRVTLAIALFIFSSVPIILAGIYRMEQWFVLLMVAVLFLMISLGIVLLIPAVTKNEAYNAVIGEGNYTPTARDENKFAEKIGGVYWPVIVAIYLGWSFWTMGWGYTWIIWPVAGVLFAALVGLGRFRKS